MRFHAMLPVRDEGDIVGQCLQNLLGWADAVHVFDTGSVDATWDIVQDFAARDSRVRVLGRKPVYFSDTLARGWMFHQARGRMREGDWFLRVDTDEIHHVPPPEFVRQSMRRHETIAYHQYYDFRLLRSEADAWERGEETVADRARPIEDRRRHYTVSVYSEPRLCRYRASMCWPERVSFPYNAGYLARERLPIRHYPHRDPPQLRRRCRLRALMMADAENRSNWTSPELHHWADGEWRNFITPDDLPGLRHWAAGATLPVFQQINHLRPAKIRAVQRIVHALLLPALDRTRRGFSEGQSPLPIPEPIIKQIEQELGSR